MTTTAKLKVCVLRVFILAVYGYSDNAYNLAELPGWPQSLRPLTSIEIDREEAGGPIYLRFRDDERDLTLEEACKTLNVLQDNHLGYSATMSSIFNTYANEDTIYAWLVSPNGRPRVAEHGSREWLTLTKNTLNAEVVKDYSREFHIDREEMHKVNEAFKSNANSLRLREVDKLLGG